MGDFRMPQVFKIGSYWVYFWSNENDPLEPVHVHVAEGSPQPNATKIWLTRTGKCLLANNNSDIPAKTLRNIMRIIESQHQIVFKSGFNILNKFSFTADREGCSVASCRLPRPMYRGVFFAVCSSPPASVLSILAGVSV